MRSHLKNFKDREEWFFGQIERFGEPTTTRTRRKYASRKPINGKKPYYTKILLKSVYYCDTLVADHVWISTTPKMLSHDPREGDWMLFKAVGKDYFKKADDPDLIVEEDYGLIVLSKFEHFYLFNCNYPSTLNKVQMGILLHTLSCEKILGYIPELHMGFIKQSVDKKWSKHLDDQKSQNRIQEIAKESDLMADDLNRKSKAYSEILKTLNHYNLSIDNDILWNMIINNKATNVSASWLDQNDPDCYTRLDLSKIRDGGCQLNDFQRHTLLLFLIARSFCNSDEPALYFAHSLLPEYFGSKNEKPFKFLIDKFQIGTSLSNICQKTIMDSLNKFSGIGCKKQIALTIYEMLLKMRSGYISLSKNNPRYYFERLSEIRGIGPRTIRHFLNIGFGTNYLIITTQMLSELQSQGCDVPKTVPKTERLYARLESKINTLLDLFSQELYSPNQDLECQPSQDQTQLVRH